MDMKMDMGNGHVMLTEARGNPQRGTDATYFCTC